MTKDLPGSYLLVARLTHESQVQVGKLGSADFPPGFYVYCGSALGGLSGRIGRHLGCTKRLHWHVDYLLAVAKVEQIWCCPSTARLECRLSEGVSHMKGARLILTRFGASDCRCPSHLWFFKKRPGKQELSNCFERLGVGHAFHVTNWCDGVRRHAVMP